MEKIIWKKLTSFKKIIFSLGWLSVLNLVFWIALLIYHVSTKEKKFFTPGSFRVVYVFGWINFVTLLILLLGLLFFMPWFAVTVQP